MANQQLPNGWIKTYRKLVDSQVWQNPHLLKLWLYCLLTANHKDKWVPVDGLIKPVLVKRGQFITGRFALHKALYPRRKKGKPAPSTVWRKLVNLQSMGNLNINTHNKYSIVTICNYETYQSHKNENEQQFEQQVNNNCTQPRMNKNIYRPNSNEFRLSELLFNEIKKRKPDHKKPNLQKWAAHIDRMIRLDNRNPARIEEVICWCQQDGFWKNNILSTDKLREQFDKLELKMPQEPAAEPLYRGPDGLTPRERRLGLQTASKEA